MALAGFAAPALRASSLYVSSRENNTIRIFNNAEGLNDDPTPSRVISGATSGWVTPAWLWLDRARDHLYAGSCLGNAIYVWHDASTVNGDLAPTRTIAGSQTGLDFSCPVGVVLDGPRDELYVVTFNSGVRVFAGASTADGNVAPGRVIESSSFDGAVGPFYDSVADRLYVGNRLGNSILVFDNASTINGAAVVPSRTITGPATQLANPEGLWLDRANDRLYTANNGDRVVVFAGASTAMGDVAPARVIQGAATQLDFPVNLWLDAATDQLYVVNSGRRTGTAGGVVVFAGASTAQDNVAPARVGGGPNTGIMDPTGIWLRPVAPSGCSTIALSPASIPAGRSGVAYAQTFSATGGVAPVAFSLAGTLPAGLSFSPSTATLSGTPTQSGRSPLVVAATDGNGCRRNRPQTLLVTSAAGTGATALTIDASGNSVFDPNETVVVDPSWFNNSGGSVTLTGAASGFTGPAGPAYVINDDAAGYGTLANDASASCSAATTDCYQLTVTAASRPATHWDATFVETPSAGDAKTWTVHMGGSFADATASHPFYRFIETLLHNGVTSGCTSTQYCPGNSTTRAQMAVFLLRSQFGSAYTPPPATGLFQDVPATDPFARWIEELASRGITSGCSISPPLYCPTSPITRGQMAVFLSRTFALRLYGP